MTKLCSIPDCDKPARALGWCWAHYTRARRNGGPLNDKPRPEGKRLRFLLDTVLPYEGDECLIWPYVRDDGGYARLTGNDKSKRNVCRFVCRETNGPPPTPAHEAAHSCGNGHLGCVARNHLSWKSRAENKEDELIHGTRNRGERHGNSRLTVADVREIRLERLSAALTAKQFGVNAGTIHNIRQRKTWNWLPD